jgi:hypothetical protein
MRLEQQAHAMKEPYNRLKGDLKIEADQALIAICDSLVEFPLVSKKEDFTRKQNDPHR